MSFSFFVCLATVCLAICEASERADCERDCSNEDINPVCGSNDQIYYNECLLQKEMCRTESADIPVTRESWSVCAQSCSIVCGREEIREICGSDGNIHRSPCWLITESCSRSEPLTQKPMSYCNGTETGGRQHGCDKCNFQCDETERQDETGEVEMEHALCEAAKKACEKHCSCDYTCPGVRAEKIGDATVYTNWCEIIKDECRLRTGERKKSRGRARTPQN